jgi:hypothetical protein
LRYLQTRPEISTLPLESIHTRLYATGRSIVTRTDLEVLEKVEQNRAFHLGLPEFKFDNNADMLAVMGMGVPRPISLRG